MDFEVSDRREPVSCQHFESEDGDDDDDGIPLSKMFPHVVGLVKCDGSVKKRDSMFDSPDSLHVSVKKSKLSPYLDQDKDDDDLRQVIDNIDKDRERKEEELKALSQKIAEITVELMAKEIEVDAANNSIGELEEKLESEKKKLLQVISLKKRFEGRVEELESKEKHLGGRVKELESREKQLEGNMEDIEPKEKKELVNELESEKKHIESRLQELELKEKQFEGQKKEFQSKEEEFKGRVKVLESKEEEFEDRVKEFKSEKKQFESQVENFQSRGKELELKKIQVEEFELKEKQFGRQVKHIESRLQELELKEKQFEGQKKEFQSKEEEFKGRVKVLESKEEEFKGRVKEFKSEKKQFESQVENFQSRWKELELKDNKFIVQVKEFELKEKQFGRQVKGLESKMNKLDGQLKKPESAKKKHDALTEHIAEEKDLVASYMDDQLSRNFSGTSLQLYISEKIDGLESLHTGILVDLLESSDPSRFVLDMIQNPIVPPSKKGDNVVIIANYQILLLEQLMKISPNIEPCVRDEALKLALDMKANMKENSKNSLVVLGFLLLLSNYGLVTSFDEDELLELFAFVAQHKIAVELFGTLGFANKVSDFVENLVRRKQFVVAVAFISAYNLADKNKLVDLLQEHVKHAKLICESSCKKTNSIEIKDKARDQEIASLRTVLQCILDHNLQSVDLLDKEIQYRILELKAHKGH